MRKDPTRKFNLMLWVLILSTIFLTACFPGKQSSATQSPTPQATATPAGQNCQPIPGKIEEACIDPLTGLKYLLYLPDAPSAKLPVLIYLHGFSHSGSNLNTLLPGGIPAELENSRKLPMVAISPQCPYQRNWQFPDMIELLSQFVPEMVDLYHLDAQRVYLTGFSMGGDGVWAVGIAHPELFAALVPVGSWYRDVTQICKVKDIPVWDFQGEADEVVAPVYAKTMVKSLQDCGGNIRLTLLPDAGHESSSAQAYQTDELYQWLLEQRK